MIYEIKNRWNEQVLFSIEADSLKSTVETAIKTQANLAKAYLSTANLYGAKFEFIFLWGMKLKREMLT